MFLYINNISICLVRLAITVKNKVEFLRSCGEGDLESVTQLLTNNPSLIEARIRKRFSDLKGKL